MMNRIDRMITDSQIEMCRSVDEIIKIQKGILAKAEGGSLIREYMVASDMILRHKNVDSFDKDKIIKNVKIYAEIGKKNTENPKIIETIPERSRDYYKSMGSAFEIQIATAHILADKPGEANEYMDKYLQQGGSKDGEYCYLMGQINELKGNKQTAFDAFFNAAGLDYRGADKKAEAVYKQLHGNTDGFEKMLQDKLAELPFHPKKFNPETKWAGKAALIELFTGSECPPCVAADLGFDGLLESFDEKYLVVLEYHLPIPRPDPMMNPATKLRADYYGARSTPSTFFAGEKKHGGGGGKGNAEKKYNDYAGTIKEIVAETPSVKLKVSAKLVQDVVKVTWSSDKKPADVDYNFALVQAEEKHKGRNGLVFHKMVVRDFASSENGGDKNIAFNITESEKAAEKYLHEYETEKEFKFEILRNKINRADLKVVFFIQDKNTKEILNAVICDVKS